MRGYSLYPATPLTQVWPSDFAPTAVTAFEALPLDPLVVECEACKLRAACRAEQFAKIKCGERQLEPRKASECEPWNKGDTSERIIDALRAYGPQTVYDLQAIGIGKYGTLRQHIDALRKAGRINTTHISRNGTHVAVYSLEE